MKMIVTFKLMGTVTIFVTAAYFIAQVASQTTTGTGVSMGVLIMLTTLISLAAIHSLKDRDYSKEPVSQDESRRSIVDYLVNHLESTAHAYENCEPCPVPALLQSLKTPFEEYFRQEPAQPTEKKEA